MKNRLTILVILAITMAGCAHQVGPRAGTGSLLGAGAGALIGSQLGSGGGQIAAVALGTLAGALMGQDIGRTLDRADQAYMQQNAQRSLEAIPTNRTSRWVNPDTGHSGSMTPTKTYRNNSRQYCREYQQTVVINGSEQRAYGQACRQADASWKIISSPSETQIQTVTRYVPTSSYRSVYQPSYYPGYGAPAYLWPATSLSLSFGDFSGHRHHRGHRGYGEYGGYGRY